MRKLAISALAIASVLVVSSSSSYAFGGRMGFGAPTGLRMGGMAGPGFASRMEGFIRPSSVGGGLFGRPLMSAPAQSRGGWPGGYNQVVNNARPGNGGGVYSNQTVNGNGLARTYAGARGSVWNLGQSSNLAYNSRSGQNVAMNVPPPVMPAMPQGQMRPMPTYQPGYQQPAQTVQPTQNSSGGSDFAQTVQSIGSTVTSVLGTIGVIGALF